MIKRIVINCIIIIVVTVLIYSKYINIIGIKNVIPDIFFLFVFFNGYFINPSFGMIFGFFAGLSKDIFSLGLLGFNSLIYLIIGYFTLIPKKLVEIDNVIVSIITVSIFFILKTIVYIILGSIFVDLKEIIIYFKEIFIIEFLYTIVISMPFFFIYKKIFESKRKDYLKYE